MCVCVYVCVCVCVPACVRACVRAALRCAVLGVVAQSQEYSPTDLAQDLTLTRLVQGMSAERPFHAAVVLQGLHSGRQMEYAALEELYATQVHELSELLRKCEQGLVEPEVCISICTPIFIGVKTMLVLCIVLVHC